MEIRFFQEIVILNGLQEVIIYLTLFDYILLVYLKSLIFRNNPDILQALQYWVWRIHDIRLNLHIKVLKNWVRRHRSFRSRREVDLNCIDWTSQHFLRICGMFFFNINKNIPRYKLEKYQFENKEVHSRDLLGKMVIMFK